MELILVCIAFFTMGIIIGKNSPYEYPPNNKFTQENLNKLDQLSLTEIRLDERTNNRDGPEIISEDQTYNNS